MKNIKNFKDFINESSYPSFSQGMSPSTGFGYSDLSSINTGGSVAPKDPTISFNAWDKFKFDNREKFSRLGTLLQSIFGNGGGFSNYQDTLDVDIEDLSILRLERNNNGLLDIYLRFLIEEHVCTGIIKNWGGNRAISFKTSLEISPTANEKLKNIFSETLIEWFKPYEDCEYRTLKEIRCYDNLGNICIIPVGGKIITEKVANNTIEFTYNDKVYNIRGLDYYFFNYWFKTEEKNNFYL